MKKISSLAVAGMLPLLALAACSSSAPSGSKPGAGQSSASQPTAGPVSEPPSTPASDTPSGPPSEGSLPDPPLYDPSTDAEWRIITYSGCDIRLQKVETSSNPKLGKYVKTVSKWFDYDTYTFFQIDVDNTKGSEPCSVGNVTIIGEDQEEHEADGLSFWLEEGDVDEIPADPDYPDFVDLTDSMEAKSDRKPGTKGTTWTLFHDEVEPFVSVYVNDGTPMANVS